jgi:hypothetical protein
MRGSRFEFILYSFLKEARLEYPAAYHTSGKRGDLGGKRRRSFGRRAEQGIHKSYSST